jgi:hypothetical protein
VVVLISVICLRIKDLPMLTVRALLDLDMLINWLQLFMLLINNGLTIAVVVAEKHGSNSA